MSISWSYIIWKICYELDTDKTIRDYGKVTRIDYAMSLKF